MPESEREGRRIELKDCVFCPFRYDDICVVYQQALEDRGKKPGHCKYIAVIMEKGIDNG